MTHPSHICVHLSYRYSHDSSETTQDNIEFTATDGTSSVIFVLQVMVIKEMPNIQHKTENLHLLHPLCPFPGEAHQ